MGARVAKLRKFGRTPTAAFRNVEKVLEEKKPAQRHPTSVKVYEKLVEDNPHFKTIITEKNHELHKRLETVRVESSGAPPTAILKAGKSVRKLDIIPEGKLSNDQLEELFINRKISPDIWTVEKIAEAYKLDVDVSKNLLSYFSSFRIYKEPSEESSDKPLLFFQKDKEKDNV